MQVMNTQDPQAVPQEPNGTPTGKTIDLAGVASFAALVELLAQELGTSAGKMLGHLPSGPNSFNELVGEIDMNGQGFYRRLTVLAQPSRPITLRFQVAWNDGHSKEAGNAVAAGVTSDYYLGATVEQIVPQGRALARHIEDIFAVMDRMVTLGQSNRLSVMDVSAADLQALEASESDGLIKQHTGRSAYKP
jgi:hypothetical protein